MFLFSFHTQFFLNQLVHYAIFIFFTHSTICSTPLQLRTTYITATVPPERVSIKDESDTERNTVVGPYSEGDLIKLKCDVYGGKPTPTISWYRDGIPLGAETNFIPHGRHLRSEITLGPLTRQDLNSRLTCKSVNHQKMSPIETTVQLDMNCKLI